MTTAPTLVFGWGNPSRGDDALGPLFVERFATLTAARSGHEAVECLTDFQLQVEHALDLKGRARVLFVDADARLGAPVALTRIAPATAGGPFSHALSPQAVMQVFVDVDGHAPPPCWLLAIRGEAFELGDVLSPAAAVHLEKALTLARDWLDAPRT